MKYVTDRATDHTTDCIITTEQLTKKYKNFTSVNNVSLPIRKVSIYGFLGPNGSGKTTSIRMMCGLITPDSGEGTCLGMDIFTQREKIKKKIGYMTQYFSMWGNEAPTSAPRKSASTQIAQKVIIAEP